MKKLLASLILCLTIGSAVANPYCGGGGYRGGYCGGGRAWVSYNYGGYAPVYNGGGCYAPIVYGNPYAYGYCAPSVVPVATGPATGIGITLFGLNILGINPTLPVAVPAQ
jgi:hypothetical protein